MKKIFALVVCMLLCLANVQALAEDELVIVHATDMHYLSPTLTDYGDAFMEVIEAADGKVTHYTPQIMQAFVDDMLALQPDAIVLTGDLTLNGAPQSHAELAEILQPLKEAGIQVLALSGNHDSGAAAYAFRGEEVIPVDGMPDEDIDDVYLQLGYADAISRDAASMSYVAQVSPKVWCLMVDVNANGTAGTVNEQTFTWIEEQLLQAQQAGITVISATHQPVLVHNRMFTFGYVINNNTRLMKLYEQYDVPLNLCGHLHMQHIAQSGDMVEVAASSLAVSPNQYGVLRVKDGQLLDYEMRHTDVAAWAARTGATDPNLLDFADFSAAFFDQTTHRQVQSLFADSTISPEEQEQMIAFAVCLNADYFAGMRTVSTDDPAWALWETHLPGSFFTYYMRSILNEEPQPMNQFIFQLDIE